MKTQKQVLFDSGLIENGTSEQIKIAKKEYRKSYMREYKRESRKNNRETVLLFSKNGAAIIEIACKNHNLTFANFIKQAVFAYINSCFIVADKNQVQCLERLLRNMLNLINSVARKSSKTDQACSDDIREIRSQIVKMEVTISNLLRDPPSLETFIENGIKNHPQLLPHLRKILLNHNTNDHKNKDEKIGIISPVGKLHVGRNGSL